MNNELQKKINELHKWREHILLKEDRNFCTQTDLVGIEAAFSYLAYIENGKNGIPDEKQFSLDLDKLLADLETTYSNNS